MKKSLTFKMFILVFVSIVLIFTIMATIQYIYYANFYEYSKIKDTAHNLISYVDDYEHSGWTDQEKLIQVKNFNIKNNASLDIINADMFSDIISFSNDDYIITGKNSTNDYYDFLITESDYNTLFPDDFNFEQAVVSVSGVVDSYQTIYPSHINSVEILNDSDIPPNSIQFIDDLSVIEIYNPSNQSLFFSKDLSSFEYSDPDLTVKEGFIEDVEYVISSYSTTTIKQVNFFYEKNIDNVNHVFNVNVSLQSVSESMIIYQKFLPLFIIVTVFIALMVSFIYSKQISKPIVKITGVANNMSHLNFDESLPTNRIDELGILSISINRLSTSLKNALDELSEANVKLKEDYENEIRQELIRKNFVANVSHEIKTPLGIIKSYAEGIKDVVKKEKQDYYIDVIIDEIDRMDILLQELLELSKLDGGHVKYKLQSFDFKETLDKLLLHNQATINQNNLDISIAGDFMNIQADSEKMYRALNNLLTNAIKYALPSTTIKITARVSKDFIFEIENECESLTEEQNILIWRRFFKADESHNRNIEGNGLGLSIVKSIIEGHHFTCSSQITQRGILFRIVVPLSY